MLPEDYVAYQLTGERTTTPQGLSQMRLWNFEKGCLDEAVLDALEIPKSLIPEIRGDTGLHGKITHKIQHETGLLEGTPVHAKAGDQQSAAIANGAVTQGDSYVNSGTSGIIGIITRDMKDKSGKGIYWMKHLNHTAINLACTLSCGASYKWLRDNVFADVKDRMGAVNPEFVYPVINLFAERAPAGSGGVIWLPYLKGERSPRDDSTIRAGFVGIDEKIPREHLARAVLEGVAHSFRHCQQVLAQQGNTFEKVRASHSGLLSESSPFMYILADDLQVPIEFVNNPGGCFGVALAAGVGAEVYHSLETACTRTIRPTSVIQPRQENRDAMTRSYEMFVEVGDRLSEIFAKRAQK
jgi:xylulokinase